MQRLARHPVARQLGVRETAQILDQRDQPTELDVRLLQPRRRGGDHAVAHALDQPKEIVERRAQLVRGVVGHLTAQLLETLQ